MIERRVASSYVDWTGTIAATVTLTLTLVWSIDAATDAHDPDLWPIGALMVASATYIGFVTISGLSKAICDRGRAGGDRTRSQSATTSR